MTLRPPYFFGYGSLVNTATHDYQDPQPARLDGWRRKWCHTALRDVAFLTVEPAPEVQIDGLIAAVPNADWQGLDRREFAYDRLAADHQIQHPLPGNPEISLYAVPLEAQNQGSARHPILLSYLDVVVQGHLQVFGETGVDDFFASTRGWDAPILNDRQKPRYPRHQLLTAVERQLVDHHLNQLKAQILT
ncbi:gamma-glutamylcyclotransferase family protein [Pseudophaeobacter sp. EL27]|uniref:gamma-glutamylcyclotransferase family protein n=1 Tax=Pseudophaeobacter sp. EL27 TaxID=2107580 RepID=UPI000EFC628F|nr:gamma-glutamylcyclotransferase family protein [Pseudophaeobacter sp. EL27]